MSEFKNKTIQKGSGKDFFLICKILEKLENREEINFIRDYIEKIALSNQECIRLLENIHYNSLGISHTE